MSEICQYLVGTRHIDDEDRLSHQTTIVLIQKDMLVAYRRLVLKDGTVFQRDIARLTDTGWVGRAELEQYGTHSTDPEIVVSIDNIPSSSGDALIRV